MNLKIWRIGTRGSPLALAQAEETRARLIAAHGLEPDAIEIVPIKTSGDRIQDRPLSEAGGKGLFTKEIEEALLGKAVDFAVHSAKDMPTWHQPGLTIGAALEREDVRDVLIVRAGIDKKRWIVAALMDALASSKPKSGLDALPEGALVGTASLRRQALVLRARPDVKVETFRGNVQTRLRKLAEGEADATLLALAGLKRLGLEHEATVVLDAEGFPPAVGQGVIAIEARADDAAALTLLAAIDHRDTRAALAGERAFLAALDGSCRTPIAGHARVEEGRMRFDGLIISPDGRRWHAASRLAAASDAAEAGKDAGQELAALGGPGFFN